MSKKEEPKKAEEGKKKAGGKEDKEKKQKVWSYYSVDKSGVKRLKKECPRCKGNVLAEHKDRRSCGNCGYTEYKTKGAK